MILKVLLYALSVYVTGWVLPGVTIDNYLTSILLAITLGALNTFVKPILILLSAPITLLTLGLFIFVIDAFIIKMASSLLDGFIVDSWGWAMAFSIVLSLVSSLLENRMFKKQTN